MAAAWVLRLLILCARCGPVSLQVGSGRRPLCSRRLSRIVVPVPAGPALPTHEQRADCGCQRIRILAAEVAEPRDEVGQLVTASRRGY
jgi:hypothetical protein